MSILINTNSAATLAANNLASSNSLLQRSLNRLSSGSKIVNPADDAGGLAVSMKLSAAAKRQGAVGNNIGNSVSYLQSQDGVMKVAGKVLERISELKTLASDPTKNSDDLANYNAEFTALQSELTSLSLEKFNGVALFGSSTLDVSTTESGDGVINTGGIDLMGTGASATPAWTDITALAIGADWTASGPTESGFDIRFHASGTLTSTQADISGPYTMNFTFWGLDSGGGAMTLSGGGSGSLDFKSITGALDTSDHAMAITVDENGDATWSLDSGAQTGSITGFAAPGGGAIEFTADGNSDDLHILKSGFNVTASAASGTSNSADITSAASLSTLDLSTITSAIQDIAGYRAQNGAQQSRLGFASEVLSVNKANLEAANSRIIDVDVAEESTALARYNVLVQAGTSMLAQANQSPQVALRLLG